MNPPAAHLLRKPAPDNDDSRAATDAGFHRAHVSDAVWSHLLRLKLDPRTERDYAWSDAEDAARSLYAPLAAPAHEPFVFAQIGQSLDGRVATENGDARNVSGRDGLRHLHRCRALADAVVVGVNTVLSDNPQLTVRLVDGASPARVVIDPNGRLPDDCGLLAQRGRKLVVQFGDRPRPKGTEAIRINATADRLDPHAIVAALAERGFRRILVEGGGTTIGRFLDAGALDRLHVAISPLLIGAGPAGLNTSPIPRLADALRPRTSVYGLGTDIVFDCALERRLSVSAAAS
jgi:riboflavin-specific deaminase-like protein